jgi:hypothetical protein
VEWLKTHQRESGRWFTRSLNQDNMHDITHAGRAMAVMALAACDAEAVRNSAPVPQRPMLRRLLELGYQETRLQFGLAGKNFRPAR